MISLDIHGVKSISAQAGSCGDLVHGWVKLNFEGPEAHFEFIAYFTNKLAAEAYAAAINDAKVIAPIDEQRAA